MRLPEIVPLNGKVGAINFLESSWCRGKSRSYIPREANWAGDEGFCGFGLRGRVWGT
jgi:hypothetical protein